MVNIQLLCVGKLKEKHFSAACAEYQKRLGAFCKLTVTELPEVRLPEHPTPTQGEGALAKCLCHELDHLDGVVFWEKAICQVFPQEQE